jgi:hypothetical protein
MGKSFNKLVEDKKQNHFRVLQNSEGKFIKRTFHANNRIIDIPLEEDKYLFELNMGFDDVPH